MDPYTSQGQRLLPRRICGPMQGESDLQMRDVRNLFASVTTLDRAYLSRWAEELGLAAVLGKVLAS